MNEIAVQALRDILNPIYMLEKQLKEGEQFDGKVAFQLTRDPNFLQEIALKALKEIEKDEYFYSASELSIINALKTSSCDIMAIEDINYSRSFWPHIIDKFNVSVKFVDGVIEIKRNNIEEQDLRVFIRNALLQNQEEIIVNKKFMTTKLKKELEKEFKVKIEDFHEEHFKIIKLKNKMVSIFGEQ